MIKAYLCCSSDMIKPLVPSSVHSVLYNFSKSGYLLKFNRTTKNIFKQSQGKEAEISTSLRNKTKSRHTAAEIIVFLYLNKQISGTALCLKWIQQCAMADISYTNQLERAERGGVKMFQEVGHQTAKPRGDGEASVGRRKPRSWHRLVSSDAAWFFCMLVWTCLLPSHLPAPAHTSLHARLARRGERDQWLKAGDF